MLATVVLMNEEQTLRARTGVRPTPPARPSDDLPSASAMAEGRQDAMLQHSILQTFKGAERLISFKQFAEMIGGEEAAWEIAEEMLESGTRFVGTSVAGEERPVYSVYDRGVLYEQLKSYREAPF